MYSSYASAPLRKIGPGARLAGQRVSRHDQPADGCCFQGPGPVAEQRRLQDTRQYEGNVNEAVSRAKTDVTGPSKSAKDKAVESSSLSITDLVRRVNLQVHIKRILVISWQSADCNGFAFMQQRLDLQLRLIREKHGKTVCPLLATRLSAPGEGSKGTSSAPYTSKIALTTTTTTGSRSPQWTMFCEAEFADLYVWD